MGQRDALVLSELQAGVLPCDRTVKTWYGFGTGDVCNGCSEVVTPPEVKLEADLVTGRTLRFHWAYFEAWTTACQ